MKKTKDYVKEFSITTNSGSKAFNNRGFIEAFIEEFNERVELTKLSRDNQVQEFSFNIFQNIVKEMEDKFWAISNKKPGPGFTQGLWNTFYAIGVIKAREIYFPKEHAEICARREKMKLEEAKQDA